VTSLTTTFDRAPRFAGSEYGLRTAQALAALMMLAALWAAGAQRAAVLLFIPTLAAHLLYVYWGDDALRAVSLLLRVAFFGFMTGLIIWRTLREPDVSLDTIAGAACAYTLLAVIWAGLYVLMEVLHPGSFNIPVAWQLGNQREFGPALAYFSFVTLTTVGYGDITPAWPGAAGLAVSEAVVAQLYLAITIARLVGLHASRRG
jgi:hypothetical protein